MSKPFEAMFNSRCPRCGSQIEAGTMVKMASMGTTRKAVHVDCSAEMPVAVSKTAKKPWVGPEASFERRAEDYIRKFY